MKEILLQPSDMIEELMYHIMWNEFDGELDPDHKYFPLYLSLQQLLEDETKRLEEWIRNLELECVLQRAVYIYQKTHK